MLQTMDQLKTGLDQNKISTTENFIKNKHGVHLQDKAREQEIHTTMENKRKKVRDEAPPPVPEHQYIVGYDSISDSSYVNIPHFFNADKVISKISSKPRQSPIPSYGPSQQSHFGINADSVSQTNRPHFDQISDATKYV